MTKKLIINADDFGLSKEVNEAVKTAHTQGVLTSATIMANMSQAAGAVRIAKKLPNLGVGVHLNLTEGKPLSEPRQVECLLDDCGNFCLSHRKLAFLSVISHPVRKAITTELKAQIEWLIDNGIRPTHLDSHKHLHFFPAIFSIVCSLARLFEIGAVRFCYEPAEVGSTPWPISTEQGRISAKTLRCFSKINRLSNRSLFKTEMLFGIAHMGKIDASFFKAISLYSPAQSAEVMMHPSTINSPDSLDVTSRPKGKVELQALCDERAKEALHKADIELVNYGMLSGKSNQKGSR